MADVQQAPGRVPPGRAMVSTAPDGDRPSVWSLCRDQVVHANRETWRTPVAMLVTLLLPLVFLVINGLAMGAGPGAAGGEVIQRLVPGVAVFAVAMAAFVMLPFSVALAAEQGILKRLRGTPLPAWAYLAGRLGAAAWLAVVGTTLMLVIGVAAYGLQVPPRTLSAFALGLAVTIVTLAALGLALALLFRSSQAVLSLTMGAVVLLGFVSDLYGFDAAMPRWLEVIGWALPLRHAVEVLAVPLQVGVGGSGVAVVSLLALVAWAALGGAIATVAYGREPSAAAGRAGVRRGSGPGALAVGSSGPFGMVWGQLRYANRSVWREPIFAGFALVLPTLFVTILPLAVGNPEIDGVTFAASMTTGMPVFGAALIAYVAMPELVASARDRGVLKRLRGTPLPAWAFVTGRVLSVFWIVTITVALVLGAGWLLYDTAPVAAAWPALLLVLTVVVASLAALGLAVAAVAPNADSVPAITLATFLPLVFLSGIFPLGDALPAIVPTIVAWLPIAPAVDAVREAFASGGILVRELAVLGGWATIGVTVAVARFRWE